MPELHFKGKEFVYNHHLTVPFRPLLPQPDKSCGTDPDNLIIQGDNLHALKSLLPRYAGKVDLVFIDPPYNTGNEGWAYNDKVNSPLMKKWLSGNPVNAEDMLRHDKWLCMMWPRLKLLHELLSDDGTIALTIDNNEDHRLRAVLDEIFGEERFVANIVWQSKDTPGNNSSGMAETHNHVLIYSKSGAFQGALLERSQKQVETYTNPDKDKRGLWLAAPLTRAEHRDRDYYELINKVGKRVFPPKGSSWRRPPDKMKWLAKEGRIWWGVKGDAEFPMEKKFLSEAKSGVVNQTWWPYEFAGSTRNAGAELKAIFDGEKPFDTPKPTKLIQRLLELTTEVDALILDSFAGSGTTAHAVLAQNAKDGGNRKFILVECEDYADTLTAERVRRVINGYKFSGTQREELLREKVTMSALKKADQLLNKVALVEDQNAGRFDAIKKTIKAGELTVTGEKSVAKRTAGLGGGFTYCTLGDELTLDDMLTGKRLPSFEAFGGYLFHTATGQPLDPAELREADGYLGESAQYHVWLVYKPDLDFLKSRDAALTLSLAEKIAATGHDKRHLVFAPARFVPQKKLLELGVEHAPLPYALYRIEKG